MYKWLQAALRALFAAARRPAPPQAPSPRHSPPRSAPVDDVDEPPAKKAETDDALSEREEKVGDCFTVKKLPEKAKGESQKASLSNAAPITESAAEAEPTSYQPPQKRRRTVEDKERVELDKMPCGPSVCSNKGTPSLFHKPVPRLSTNASGTHNVKPAPGAEFTPTLPKKEHAVVASVTLEVSKMGRFFCTAEEAVKQEEKKKYKQLVNLVKEKNPRHVPTLYLKGQAYLKKPAIVLEEQKCERNIYTCVPQNTWFKREDVSSPQMPLDCEVIRGSIQTPDTEKEGGPVKEVLAGKQNAADVSGEEADQSGPPCPPLTEDMETEISAAFAHGEPNEIMSTAFRMTITRSDIHTLQQCSWLNDQIINFYMCLLEERSKTEGYPAVHAFNTFFYPKLTSGGYLAVKRWTRKVNLFEKDIILVPLNVGRHWTLAVIDIRHKSIKYFDSFAGDGRNICQTLFKYLQEESREKRKVDLDSSEWALHSMKSHEIPQQQNGSDCGVFACKYAECVSRDEPLTFTQSLMPYFRRRMVWEIMHQQLL